MSELKPCPFCGSSHARITVLLSGPYVYCPQCLAETCCHASEESAVTAWNTRQPDVRVDDAAMVERVARALVTSERAEHHLPPCAMTDLTDIDQHRYAARARAALSAIRDEGAGV